MISIEKGIQIPQKKAGAAPKYPFAEMVIGDSFLCEVRSSQTGVSATLTRAGRRHSMAFTSRVVEEGRIRVWRIA